jgi:hypothetical protein
MGLSQYHVIQYILETFPKNEYNIDILEKKLIEISRIFGKKHILPEKLVNGLMRTCSSNQVLLEILCKFRCQVEFYNECHNDREIDRLHKHESWRIRRDAGNMLAIEQEKQKRESDKVLCKRVQEEVDARILQDPYYKNILDNAIEKKL